jgi:sulfhydrogenase subunit alpha
VRWANTLSYPDFEQDYEFVAIHHEAEYGILEGDVWSSSGKKIPVNQFEANYLEEHVRHSNALHSHTSEGTPYITGPLSRLNLNYNQLRPITKSVCDEIGLKLPLRNPYKALLARAIELVDVTDEAIQQVNEYDPQGSSYAEIKIHAGEGQGASEAPRGLLYHRYVIDENGLIRHAKIVPPTAQNLARMEADLWGLAPRVLQLPHEEATLACEHLVRSYDPCISCATHFLKLHIDDQT